MRNIVYFCPSTNVPIGGVKVIHRHSELLNAMGVKSEVYYGYDLFPKKVSWFNHKCSIRRTGRLDPECDFAILPESLISDRWKKLKALGVEYAIFVQNAYLSTNKLPDGELIDCYASAKLLICISEDSIKCMRSFFPEAAENIVRVTYSVDPEVFSPKEVKENLISYMPRKMGRHSDLLTKILRLRLPTAWRLVPIDGMSEKQVAQTLSKSKIFLAFSDFEGLPVPPVEAAFSGNYVIGYTGQGGKEYWRQPLFEEVESGDIVGFLGAVLRRVAQLDKFDGSTDEASLALLRTEFSKDREILLLQNMVDLINQ